MSKRAIYIFLYIVVAFTAACIVGAVAHPFLGILMLVVLIIAPLAAMDIADNW